MKTSINRGTFPNYGTIDCAGQQINVYQEIMVKQVAQATTNAATTAMNKNTQVADTVKKLEQKQAAESKGLTALVTALTGPFAIAAIAFIVFLLFGAKTGFSTLTDPKKVIKILIVIGIIVGVLFARSVCNFMAQSSRKFRSLQKITFVFCLRASNAEL